jgi:hypothetical protein
MNIVLWVLQGLLALHTAMGAVWKFSNSEQTVPSLKALPHGVWIGLAGFELLCAFGLILPAFNKRLKMAAPLAAIGIAAEMILFCAVHLRSGEGTTGELIYWLVVAGFCAFVAYGRYRPRA